MEIIDYTPLNYNQITVISQYSINIDRYLESYNFKYVTKLLYFFLRFFF